MGRPSRKTIASTTMLQDTDGSVYFYKIDKKGNAEFIKQERILNQTKIPEISLENKIITNQNILEPCVEEVFIDQKDILHENYEKSQNNAHLSELDLFLEQINGKHETNLFLQNVRLSHLMIPQIIV